jgi:isoleucyl-tRNA synthetase
MTDYKDTVFLPRTQFPMRGGLPTKEPELLARWQSIMPTATSISATRSTRS